MATTTPNFGWPVPTSTDLVKDGATAIESLGDSIDASLLDLKGGTTGQVLSKNSNSDMDFTWTAVDPLVILDAKGDLITATAADTPARLAVGTNGQILTADSTAATGIKWASPSSGTPAYVGCITHGAVNLSYGSTPTAVSNLTTEIVDTNAFHSTSTNTSRMTIPSGLDGKYRMELSIYFEASDPNLDIYVYKNGAALGEGLASGRLSRLAYTASAASAFTVGQVVTGVATDYFEFFAANGSPSKTIATARYTFTYLGA